MACMRQCMWAPDPELIKSASDHVCMFPNIPQLSHRLFWRCHHHRGRDCIGGGHCGGSHCAGHHCPGWPNHGVCHRRLSQMSGAWHHWRCKRCGCWDSHWCHRCTVQEMAWATGLQTVHHIAWSASDRRDPLEALPRDPIGRNGGCNAGHVHDFGHKVSRIGTPWHNAHDAGLRHLRTSRSLKQLQDVHSTYYFNHLRNCRKSTWTKISTEFSTRTFKAAMSPFCLN